MRIEAGFNGDLEAEIEKFLAKDITEDGVLSFLKEERAKSKFVYDTNFTREKMYLFMQQPFLIDKTIDTIKEFLPDLKEEKAIEYGLVSLSKHLGNWIDPEELNN